MSWMLVAMNCIIHVSHDQQAAGPATPCLCLYRLPWHAPSEKKQMVARMGSMADASINCRRYRWEVLLSTIHMSLVINAMVHSRSITLSSIMRSGSSGACVTVTLTGSVCVHRDLSRGPILVVVSMVSWFLGFQILVISSGAKAPLGYDCLNDPEKL